MIFQSFLDHGVNGEVLCEITESDLAFVPIKSRTQRKHLLSKIEEFRYKFTSRDKSHSSSTHRSKLYHAGSRDSLEAPQPIEPFRLGPNLDYWDAIEVAMFLEEIGMEPYQDVCTITF